MATQTPSAGEAAHKLRETAHDARKLASEFQEGATELGAALRAQVHVRPYQTVLIAAGVGYVLGGGLAAPLTRRLLRLALRNFVLPALAEPFGNVVNSVVAASTPIADAAKTAKAEAEKSIKTPKVS